jgi:hypothetical protein
MKLSGAPIRLECRNPSLVRLERPAYKNPCGPEPFVVHCDSVVYRPIRHALTNEFVPLLHKLFVSGMKEPPRANATREQREKSPQP